MERSVAHQSLFYSSSVRISSFHTSTKSSSFSSSSSNGYQSLTNLGFPRIKLLTLQRDYAGVGIKSKTSLNSRGKSGFISFSSNQPSSGGGSGEDDGWKWLLEPIADGDRKDIGVKVARPGAYEIVSSSVTIGSVADKADLVIPVATVSGLHARMQKKDGKLYITDLDSTNGTFVNERRVNPGQIIPVLPGDRVSFGDTHSTIFIVSKMENVEQQAVGVEGSVQAGRESSKEEQQQAEEKVKQLGIGTPVIVTEAPKMVKTAASVPCLKVNSGFINPGDVGRIVSRKPMDVWAVRLSVGTYLIDGKYFKPLELDT